METNITTALAQVVYNVQKLFMQQMHGNIPCVRVVVVDQLAEQSIQTPEVCSSNPVISNFLLDYLFTVNCIEKTKINKKRPRMAHLKNISNIFYN